MKSYVWALPMFLAACSSGSDGSSCSVKQEGDKAKVTCEDGTEATLEGQVPGPQGPEGKPGRDGRDGVDGQTVKVYLELEKMTDQQKYDLCYDEHQVAGTKFSTYPIYLRSAINKSNWTERRSFVIGTSENCFNVVAQYVDMLNEVMQ